MTRRTRLAPPRAARCLAPLSTRSTSHPSSPAEAARHARRTKASGACTLWSECGRTPVETPSITVPGSLRCADVDVTPHLSTRIHAWRVHSCAVRLRRRMRARRRRRMQACMVVAMTERSRPSRSVTPTFDAAPERRLRPAMSSHRRAPIPRRRRTRRRQRDLCTPRRPEVRIRGRLPLQDDEGDVVGQSGLGGQLGEELVGELFDVQSAVPHESHGESGDPTIQRLITVPDESVGLQQRVRRAVDGQVRVDDDFHRGGGHHVRDVLRDSVKGGHRCGRPTSAERTATWTSFRTAAGTRRAA